MARCIICEEPADAADTRQANPSGDRIHHTCERNARRIFFNPSPLYFRLIGGSDFPASNPLVSVSLERATMYGQTVVRIRAGDALLAGEWEHSFVEWVRQSFGNPGGGV